MNNWDNYFQSHYKPLKKTWGKKDLDIWKRWYSAWIEYIDNTLHFKEVFPVKASFLEIGGGIGGVSAILKDKGWNVTGSDVSKDIIHAAAKTNKKVPFIYCDVQKKIPGSYHAILGFEVLEHIKNPLVAIKNIRGGLKRGGYFIGSSPYPYAKAYTDPTHCSVLFPEQWRSLFEKAHFAEVTLYPMSFLPFFWRIHKRLQIVIPFYVPFPAFVSTTLIIAKK